MANGQYQADIVTSISDIEAAAWNECAGDNPFLQHAFFEALEKSDCTTAETGWHPFHICLRDTSRSTLLGVMPLFVKSHSFGEYVFDHAWANALERAGGRYYPKLQSSVPFTPVTGRRLLVHPSAPRGITSELLKVARTVTSQQELSSLHITFLTEQESRQAEEELYLVRKDQQFHWKNANYNDFEDFLTQLSSRKRKQIKKERRTALSIGVEIETIEGKDIQGYHWDAFFQFYLDTGAKKWGTPYLNREFFDLIGVKMPENIVLMLCKREDRYIAGALNFKDEETLYGRYWGCIEDHPCLHFEVCYYQAIEYAIRHKFKTVEAGAQGPHKLARGYEPTLTYSAHWIENPGFRDAIKRFLDVEHHNVDAEVEYLASKTPFKNQ